METIKYTPRLADKYSNDVVPALMKKFEYKSVMQAPKLQKICVNRGVNGAVTDKKLVDVALEELSIITGQKPVATYSKKDISNFKLRKGMPIGARVTLRGEKMYEFLDRLVSVALPRVRDFKGISDKAFENLSSLTTLDISYCNQLTAEAFQHFRNIKKLNLAGCTQNTIRSDAFVNLINIEDLNFANI
jgi:large subunit ribosomal protein L5